MCKVIALIILSCAVLFGFADSTSSFDQRQTGDLNVQIGLKNIQLIALLNGGTEEYVDYDYAYDYSEMTITPQNGTTPKPLNVTTTQINTTTPSVTSIDNATETSTVDNKEQYMNATQQLNVTEHSINATDSSLNSTESMLTDINKNKTTNVEFENLYAITTKTAADVITSTLISDSLSDATDTERPAASPTHCRRGFVQNNQGKCEYKGHGTSNALRRIVKLAQKIKIGRGYKETE